MRDLENDTMAVLLYAKWMKVRDTAYENQTKFVASLKQQYDSGKSLTKPQLAKFADIIKQNREFQDYQAEIRGSWGDVY